MDGMAPNFRLSRDMTPGARNGHRCVPDWGRRKTKAASQFLQRRPENATSELDIGARKTAAANRGKRRCGTQN